MQLLAVAIPLALPALAVLIWVRSKSDGEEPDHRTKGMASVASMSAGAALALIMVSAWDLVPGFMFPEATGWQIHAFVGVYIGGSLYVLMRVVLFGSSTVLQRWACRLPPESVDPIGRRLLVELCVLGGFMVTAVAIQAIALVGRSVHLPLWTLIPLFAAILPLYSTFLIPWVRYLRARRLTCYDIAHVDAWLNELCVQRGLPRFRIRIHEGGLANAFATGGLGAHLVVIGKTLLERMSGAELRAVLAHEVAHVERRHVPRGILPLTILGITLHVLCVISLVNPLFAKEELLALLTGMLIAGVSGGLFLVGLPGIFMHRMEFRADRLAAEMLGETEPLVDALTKLAELNRQPLDARSWSHPSMQARINALQNLSTPRQQ